MQRKYYFRIHQRRKKVFLQPREQVCNNITPPNGSKSTKQSTFAEKQKCSVSDRDLMNRNWIGN